MARVTDSRDGIPRMTIRVEYRVGREALVLALCYHVAHETYGTIDEVNVPLNPSAHWIIETIKGVYRRRGTEAPDFWTDDTDDLDTDEVERWAQAAVNGAFPGLASA
jgi:hypothetical protein